MKTKIISIFLILAASVETMFAEKVKIGDLYYNLDAYSQTAEVTSQNSNSYPYWSTTITIANIPSSVTYNSVPYSVTSIGDGAFDGCTGLTSVTIPNSITSIGYQTFYGCASLTSVTIPNSVTSIGDHAFDDCKGLTSVTIPNSVTSIGYGAFYNVPDIVYFGSATGSPWGARSVNGYVDGYLVFSDETKSILLACSKSAIGNIILPNSVTILGNSAFAACTDLTSITIPNSVISIGEGAFLGCSSLTNITIPNSVTSIEGDAFCGCSSLTNITIPNSVTSIERGAFSGCSSLTDIAIPNSVTSVGIRAFSGCSSLTNITIPNSVTSVGIRAFSGCCGLTNITIPNSITSIGEGAFEGCTALASILNYATNPQPINENVFSDIYFYIYGISAGTYVIGGIKYPGVNKSTCKLFVPKESISKYKSADVWCDFNTIEPINEQDIENATIDAKPSTKILHNGQIFILRGDKTYTIDGRLVK